jgi:excisionase family DNA binding protein
MGEFSSPEEIADSLGVTSKTVREWLRTGELVGIKVGKNWRVHRRDLARLLDEQLFKARKERAERLHAETEWKRGQCRECGILMPEPTLDRLWVCSPECLVTYDKKLEIVVGRNSDAFVESCGAVVPPY